MERKPTYEELVQRVKALETEAEKRKQAEEALRRITKAVDSASDAIGMSDPQGHHFYQNTAFTDLFEYTAEELEAAGGGPAVYVDPDIARDVFKNIMTGKSWSGEIEMLSKSGRKISVSLRADVIKDDKGEIIGLIGVHTDITDRKQAEEALKESEARLREAQEMGKIGHWEFDLESEKTTWSDQVYQLYERDSSQAPPHFIEDMEVYDPDDRDRINEEVLHAIETGESVKMDFRAKLPSGRPAYFCSTFHPTKDQGGNITKVKGTVQDITDRKQAEEALRESEDKLRIVFENINEEIVYLDNQGTCLDVNKKVENIFGYKPEELIGKNITEIPFCYPDSLENIIERFNKATFGDFSNLIELKGVRKDGSEIDIEVSTNTIEKDGEIKNIITVIRDITERKKAEAALRESEEIFHDLFDLSPQAASVTELKTGKLININSKFCELTKHSKEQLLGKTSTKLGFYTEYNRNRFKKELETSGEVHGLEMEFHLKDTSTINALMFARVIGIAGEDFVITVFYDLTERKQAEEELKKSEEKYRQLANLLPQVVFESDEKGTLTFINRNAYEAFGYTEKDFEEGLNAFQMLIPKDRDFAWEKLQRTMSGEKSVGTEYNALRKDGSTFPALIYANPIINEGRPVGIRGMIADLTELKRAQEALKESEEKLARLKKMEALGLLAGGVAHDLNNVLAGIVSIPDILLVDLPKDSKLRKPLEMMQDSGNRAAAVVEDLLTVARGVATPKEPLNINDIIREYLNSPEFEKLRRFHPSVTVKTNLEPHLLNTYGSHVHFRKVIMNLVSNASEAIEGSGNVAISTMNRYKDKPLKGYDDVKMGEYVILSVSDDGSGLSPEDLEKIFDPFYSKKVMGRSGTGLGLAVVWNVIQDHNGYIDVISGEGGTTFELYFPITRDESSDKALAINVKDLKGNGETILVVDDVEKQRKISCQMLDVLGYKPFAVSSGEDAVEYLKEHAVDLILLDMIMDPGINGRETYERIVKFHPNQKAVIVSGFVETDEVKKAQKLGAGQYLKKPLTLEKIGLAIKEELKK